MRQVKQTRARSSSVGRRVPNTRPARGGGKGGTALPRKDAAPSPAQAAPETPRARRKRPGLKAAAAATTPAPAHKGRPPPRAQPGPPRLPPPSSPRAAPLGSNSRGRTHGGGVALRETPGPLASAAASARLPSWAVTAFRPRPPRPGPLLRPFGRLPGARGRTPPSWGSPRPFPLPHRKAKTIGAAQARGRKRKAGRAEAARGDAGVWAGASRATAGLPGRVRGAGSPGHPAAGAQAWPGKSGAEKLSAAASGILCCCSCFSSRCLREIQIFAGLVRSGDQRDKTTQHLGELKLGEVDGRPFAGWALFP